jgi:hypothetical protein
MKTTEENIDKFLKDLGINDGKKYNKDGTLKTISMEWVEKKALIQTYLKSIEIKKLEEEVEMLSELKKSMDKFIKYREIQAQIVILRSIQGNSITPYNVIIENKIKDLENNLKELNK